MRRILVVDDEPLISMLMQDWLAELDCETVGPAASVSAALGLIDGAALDGAILDVSLRGEDCYCVADVLRERGVPFALATGHNTANIAVRFRGELILTKPFDFDDVKGAMAKLLGSHAGL